jgi:hypothetical protein
VGGNTRLSAVDALAGMDDYLATWGAGDGGGWGVDGYGDADAGWADAAAGGTGRLPGEAWDGGPAPTVEGLDLDF